MSPSPFSVPRPVGSVAMSMVTPAICPGAVRTVDASGINQ